jgi:hypothetical protein
MSEANRRSFVLAVVAAALCRRASIPPLSFVLIGEIGADQRTAEKGRPILTHKYTNQLTRDENLTKTHLMFFSFVTLFGFS